MNIGDLSRLTPCTFYIKAVLLPWLTETSCSMISWSTSKCRNDNVELEQIQRLCTRILTAAGPSTAFELDLHVKPLKNICDCGPAVASTLQPAHHPPAPGLNRQAPCQVALPSGRAHQLPLRTCTPAVSAAGLGEVAVAPVAEDCKRSMTCVPGKELQLSCALLAAQSMLATLESVCMQVHDISTNWQFTCLHRPVCRPNARL